MSQPQYATNKATGEVMKNDGTGWSKVKSAKNAQGDILINEGNGWGEIPSVGTDNGNSGPGQQAPVKGQQDHARSLDNLIGFTREGNTGRAITAALSAANSSTLGALDPILDRVDRSIPGAQGPSSGNVRAELRKEHPYSGLAGDLAGFAAPGAGIWNAGTSAAKVLPKLPGRAAPYAARLAGLAGLGGAENAVYQSTVGASNLSAETGEPVSLSQRAEMFKEGGTNPIALAAGPAMSLAGRGISGAFTGKVTPKNLRPSSDAPSMEAIGGMKDEAYKLADELGVTYTPDSYQNLIASMETKLASEGIDPVLHQRATRTLSRMQDRVGDTPMTMQELDKIRQFVRRDVVQSAAAGATPGANAGEQRLGMMMIDAIDDFIADGAGAVGPNGQQGSEAIRQARALNGVWRKSQALQDAVENAQLRSASTGSGGNFENALRQEMRKIYQNPKKVAGFNEAERKLMRAVIEGDALQNVLRQVGRLSPQGNGLMAALGVGTTAANPVLAPIWLTAMGAKHLAQKGIKNKFDDLDEAVRGRANAFAAKDMKNITPQSPPTSTPAVTNAFDAASAPAKAPVSNGLPMLSNPTAQGGVIGAGAGAMAPADSNEERLRNMAIGGAMGAGAGRMDRKIRTTSGGLPTLRNGAPGGPKPLSAEVKNFDKLRMMQELDFVPQDANPSGPLAFATKMLRETPQGGGRKATRQDFEFQLTDNMDTADPVINSQFENNYQSVRDETGDYLNNAGFRIRIAQLRQKGLDTTDLERELAASNMRMLGDATEAFNRIADKEGFAPKPVIVPPVKTNGFGGQPIRRKDALKGLREDGSQFQKTAPPSDAPIVREQIRRREAALPQMPGPSEFREAATPLAIGAAGLGLPALPVLYSMYQAEKHKNRNNNMSFEEFVALMEREQLRRAGLPETPGLKPKGLGQ